MEEIKSIENEKEEPFVEKDIFKKIWTKPREIFKFINAGTVDKYTTILLVLAGITSAFDRASNKNVGDNLSLTAVILVSVLAGGLLGWLSFYIFGALLNWTGKWLKGKGNTNSIVRMLAYASIPAIISLLFLIPQILVLGNGIFQSSFNIFDYGIIAIIIFLVALIFKFALGIWTIILVVIGLSEVQKLSIGNSVLNLILPALIFAVPIFLITFLIGSI